MRFLIKKLVASTNSGVDYTNASGRRVIWVKTDSGSACKYLFFIVSILNHRGTFHETIP